MRRTLRSLLMTGILTGALFSGNAIAVTQSVTANIAFDTALSITKNADITFGTVAASANGDNYTISTAGAVTVGQGTWLFGTPAAANLTIIGSASQLINTSVGSYTANNGVTPSNATCAYNGGGSGSCSITGAAAPGAGKTLLIGATVTADGTQTAGETAAPTFVVTVVYQ